MTYDEAVEKHKGLVYAMAQRYYSYAPEMFEDIKQAGFLGLFSAVDKFDESLGNKFSTYALWWIRQSIVRLLGEQSIVHVPEHVKTTLWRNVARLVNNGMSADMIAVKLHKTQDEIEAIIPTIPKAVAITDLNEYRFAKEDAESDTGILIDRVLAELDKRTRDILTRRANSESLESIAQSYKLSRERIRQIQKEGLAKCRRLIKHGKLSGLTI